MMRPVRAFLRNNAAATSAEFALVVPFFLVLVFGTINGSIMMSAVTQMHYAAERAARCQAVDVAGDCDDADAYAKSMYNGPTLTGLAFAPSDQTCGKQVVGTGSYELISGMSVTTVNISSTACYPLI